MKISWKIRIKWKIAKWLNKKTRSRDPVLTVKTYKSNTYCHELKITGPSKVIYSPDKPLSCGAKVWIETESEIIPLLMKREVESAVEREDGQRGKNTFGKNPSRKKEL